MLTSHAADRRMSIVTQESSCTDDMQGRTQGVNVTSATRMDEHKRGKQMDTPDVADRVLMIIAGAVGDKTADEIPPSASLMDELGLDSLDVADVQIQLEEEFNVEISDRDAEAAHTVQDILDIVKRYVAAKEK
jgi:acyl carrier protein